MPKKQILSELKKAFKDELLISFVLFNNHIRSGSNILLEIKDSCFIIMEGLYKVESKIIYLTEVMELRSIPENKSFKNCQNKTIKDLIKEAKNKYNSSDIEKKIP